MICERRHMSALATFTIALAMGTTLNTPMSAAPLVDGDLVDVKIRVGDDVDVSKYTIGSGFVDPGAEHVFLFGSFDRTNPFWGNGIPNESGIFFNFISFDVRDPDQPVSVTFSDLDFVDDEQIESISIRSAYSGNVDNTPLAFAFTPDSLTISWMSGTGWYIDGDVGFYTTPTEIPLPAAAPLLLTGLASLLWARRRRSSQGVTITGGVAHSAAPTFPNQVG